MTVLMDPIEAKPCEAANSGSEQIQDEVAPGPSSQKESDEQADPATSEPADGQEEKPTSLEVSSTSLELTDKVEEEVVSVSETNVEDSPEEETSNKDDTVTEVEVVPSENKTGSSHRPTDNFEDDDVDNEGDEDLEEQDREGEEEEANDWVEEDEEVESGRRGPPLTKVVVRRLPTDMTKKDFIEAFHPLQPYNHLTVQNPDPEWGIEARSVATINFLNEEDALWFIGRFTGYQYIDSKGNETILICDVAMEPSIPPALKKSNTKNPYRGTLDQDEAYIEFKKRYDEDPMSFMGVKAHEGETVTPEMMLAELEGRPNKKDLVTTPLLDFIMNQQKRDSERRVRRDRPERVRERDRRDRERDSDYKAGRDIKRERKRERRDKERKERREREKLEREAKQKGMLITYSKHGKATRWSTNSSPLVKKADKALSAIDEEFAEKSKDQSSSTATESKEKFSGDSASRGKDKPQFKKTEKPFESKKKVFNPFSPEGSKKIEKSEEKSKFGKPFPIKSSNESNKGDDSKKHESSSSKEPPSAEASTSSKSLPKKDSPSQSQTHSKDYSSSKPGEEGDGKGKKKIIKKVIKVKRIIKKNGDEGSQSTKSSDKPAAGSSTDKKGESSSSSGPRTCSAAKPKVKAEGSSKSENKGEKIDKPTGAGVGEESKSKPSSKDDVDEGMKRRRARPDMQIYRPGSLRSSGNSSAKPTGETSKGNNSKSSSEAQKEGSPSA